MTRKNTRNNPRKNRESVARIAAVITAVGVLGSVGAQQAAAQVNPQHPKGAVVGGFQNVKTRQGVSVKLSLYALKARLIPSPANTPMAPQALVSGVGEFHLNSAGQVPVSKVEVKTGYMVGCQVRFDQFQTAIGTSQKGSVQFPNYVGAGGGVGAMGAMGGPIPAGAIAGGLGAAGVTGIIPGVEIGANQEQTFKLSPGTIEAVIMGDKVVDHPKVGANGGVEYSNIKIGTTGCAGVVDAIPYVTTVISTDTFDTITTAYGEIVRLA